jgi:hypothetical protein
MARDWDDIDVYQGDDDDRDQFEATHTSGFHVIGGFDSATVDYIEDESDY